MCRSTLAMGSIWGAFCPVVGILFATLISSTVDKLWARQEALRRALVSEAESLSHLTELLYQAELADALEEARAAQDAQLEYYRSSSVDVATVDAAGVASSQQFNPAAAPFMPSDWLQRQAGSHVALDATGTRHVEVAPPAWRDATATTGSTASASTARRDEPRRATPSATTPTASAPSPRSWSEDHRLTRQASYRAIARHLHTLSHLVWGSKAVSKSAFASPSSKGSKGSAKGSSAAAGARSLGASRYSIDAATRGAYEAELASISGGDDPLLELTTLHPPVPSERCPGRHWRAANAEARATISKLAEARASRLAVMESSPPRAHWVLVAFTGSSLVLGFAIVSAATRPATAVASRALFTSLLTSLLVVLRLLRDLARACATASLARLALPPQPAAHASGHRARARQEGCRSHACMLTMTLTRTPRRVTHPQSPLTAAGIPSR